MSNIAVVPLLQNSCALTSSCVSSGDTTFTSLNTVSTAPLPVLSSLLTPWASPLMSVPLTAVNQILQHHHRLLLSHLPGLDPSINRAAVTRIAKTVGEVAVELRETRLEKKCIREKKERKGAAEYLGANLAHLLNLVQVTDAKYFPPFWKALARASKHQKLKSTA